MATPTYDLIETTTLTSSASSVTFSSITQDYRDLVLVQKQGSGSDYATSGATGVQLRLNNDSSAANNYSSVRMLGDGSSASSNTSVNNQFIFQFSGAEFLEFHNIIQIMDYSATDKHKPLLVRVNLKGSQTLAHAARWADTSAVTTITCIASSSGFSFGAGSVFSLYGIAS